jgi:nitrite reductase/ring-hydroxylating ferredoxin subunit
MIRETKAPENEEAAEMQRTLPLSAYLSQETFERERERIFAMEWFCAGRGEALLAPGHFLKVDVAGESVLIVRTRSGELRGFYNVCRHRGSRIVMDAPSPSAGGPGASGRFKGSMVCPYHGWTYGLAGELRLAPFSPRATVSAGRSSRCTQSRLRGGVASCSCASRGMSLEPRPHARVSARAHRRANGALSAGGAADGASDHLRRRRQLEVHRGELQRVLPLRPRAPRAL